MPGVPLFVSYSHKDQAWLDRMTDQLAALENEKLVELWDDRDLRAGSDQGWEQQLLPKLNSAGVIVILLSPAFAASKYCQEVELPRALERKRKGEALVFLAHVRTYSIEKSLRQYQILPSDQDSIEDSPKPGIAFRDVVDHIRKELETFKPAAAPAAARAARKLPSYLPYLCDRTDQEETLQSLCESCENFSQRPIVYVLGGPDTECHEAFHERIAKDLLPRLVGIPGVTTVDPIPLDWPSRANPGPEADATFARRVALKLDSVSSKPVEVLRVLPEGLTLLVTTVAGDVWDARQQDLLRAFLSYWNSWPDLAGNRAVCAGVSIIYKRNGPTEESLRAQFADGPWPGVRFRILPDLPSPSEQHAIDWLSHRKVKPWYDWEGSRDALRARIAEMFVDRPSIPMANLASPLLQILESAL